MPWEMVRGEQFCTNSHHQADGKIFTHRGSHRHCVMTVCNEVKCLGKKKEKKKKKNPSLYNWCWMSKAECLQINGKHASCSQINSFYDPCEWCRQEGKPLTSILQDEVLKICNKSFYHTVGTGRGPLSTFCVVHLLFEEISLLQGQCVCFGDNRNDVHHFT